jgi:hypothetical protein
MAPPLRCHCRERKLRYVVVFRAALGQAAACLMDNHIGRRTRSAMGRGKLKCREAEVCWIIGRLRAQEVSSPPPAPVDLRGVVVVQRNGALRTIRGADMIKIKRRASAKARSGAKSRPKVGGQARPSAQGARVEAGCGAGAVGAAKRHDHSGHHGGDRLAGAYGAGISGRGGSEETRADTVIGKDGWRARLSAGRHLTRVLRRRPDPAAPTPWPWPRNSNDRGNCPG